MTGRKAGEAIPPYRYGFTGPDIDDITNEIGKLLRNRDHLTMGEHGRTLEEEFAAYTGCRHAVALASGTAALEAALRAAGVEGGEVIVPTNTFGATVVAVLRAGATPVLADTAPDLTVAEEDVLGKISPSTRAVITVHIGGLISPRTTVLAQACASAGIPLIEDAAHAAGSSLAGRKAGSFGSAAAYSFFSTKVMTSGEGGILVTNDDQVAATARLLRDHAKNPDGTMTVTGYNWRLTEIQAILARTQLRRLDAMVASRNTVAAAYDGALNDIHGVHPLTPPAGSVHNRYKYAVLLDQQDPLAVERLLRAQYGISMGGYVYRTPCHRQPAFAGFARGSYPGADRLCPSHICPPVYPDMPTADAAYIADALRQVLGG